MSKISEQINSIEDAFNVAGIDYQKFLSDCKAMGLEQDEIDYRLLKIGIATLNEDWVLDWGNTSQWKYYPYFNMGGSSGVCFSSYGCGRGSVGSAVCSRLCLKSRELAIHAAKAFLPQYKGFYLKQ